MDPTLSTLDDDTLAARAVRDPDTPGADAFAALYRRHLDRVYGYLLARLGNVQDAQDLTAQTFITALEHLPRYEPRGKFAAWLVGIARHKALTHLRGSDRYISLESAESLAHPAPLPEEIAARQQRMDHVAAALRTLPPDRAEALILRFFGELSLAEVAEVMDRSEAACKMLVHRALRDLKQRLIEEEPQP